MGALGRGAGQSSPASLANTLLSQPNTSSSHCSHRTDKNKGTGQLMAVLTQTGPALISRDTLRFYLLELQQEGALIFAPAVLLHPLLDELVEDGGDGLRADPLQQLEFGPRNTIFLIDAGMLWSSGCYWFMVSLTVCG